MEGTSIASLLPRVLPVFRLPRLTESTRAMVIGMGGGCDVFAATAYADIWRAENPTATVLCGGCTGPREIPSSFESLAQHVYRLPATAEPLVPGDEGYGSFRLECSVTRSAEGGPFVLVVPQSGKHSGTVDEITATNTAAVIESLTALRIDQVLAVDLGGDSLSGGADFERDAELGRDRQVLHALSASKLPFVHLVVAPGCDGETSVVSMQAAIKAADERGQLLGIMPRLGGALPTMTKLAATLSPSRTPNIIRRAMEHLDGLDEVVHAVVQGCLVEVGKPHTARFLLLNAQEGHLELVALALIEFGEALGHLA